MTIEVRCPECGRVTVDTNALRLVICRSRTNIPLEISGSFYTFTCPGCRTYYAKKASPMNVELLFQYGAMRFITSPPMEVLEAHCDGPPFQLDDLIDLHNDLEVLSA